ncbi:AAEL008071-PA [Aedes aegypti]|uniref:AAEL008071-PA n=1 Tax=Aedes aegypti TaxID=7159 RepID=Q16ZS4_AEDAE|nr:AAEL008071-PA [Aedes aegypti]
MNRTKVEEKKCELGKIDVTSPTEVVDYAAGLHREITEETNKIAFLCKTVEQKDDLIKLLLKEKSILEGEKSLLQKEQQSAIKDKESIVMRFAIVEKNLLDVKTQLEQADKREKRIQKELDTLNEKIKIAKDEKGRIASALDSKSQEHRNCLKDIEKLRTEISSLETRCKWSTVKLRQEIEAKHVLEKELHDLKNTEICTKSDNGESTLKKISELKANQITLKHVNVEQADKISALEQQLENTFKERTTLQSLLEITNDKRTKLSVDFEKLQQENLDLQHQLDTNVLKIAELQAKLNDLGTVRAQLSIVNEINNNLTEHMKNIERQLADQTADVSKFNQRESELLALNEELSSLNATLQNEISLQKSKSIAMSIENNSSKENQSHYEVNIVKLQEQLEYEKKCRYEERLVMAKHLAEKTKDCEVLQQKLDQISGDLDAVKKKNLFIVKVSGKHRTFRKLD